MMASNDISALNRDSQGYCELKSYARFERSFDNNWIVLILTNYDSSESPSELQNIRSDIDDQFDTDLTFDRLSYIALWVLDLDSSYKKKYLNNQIVRIRIPIHTPRPIVSIPNGNSESYWPLRQSIGNLIRPLLLNSPKSDFLYDYQQDGVKWLLNQTAGILADDMGLGKTVQVIAALRILFYNCQVKSILILCPKSIVSIWETELAKWAPELTRMVLTPKSKEKEESWAGMLGRSHIIITNYEQVRLPANVLSKIGVDIIVADEAHKIRKYGSQISQGVRKIKSKRFWMLTGTPIEKNAEDLATMLSTINSRQFSISDGELDASSLRSRASKHILRRRKKDVLRQLPTVEEKQEIIDLHPSQLKTYKDTLRTYSALRGQKYALVALLNDLRSICDYDKKTNSSSKIERIIEIIKLISQQKEKVVVFSYLLRPLRVLYDILIREYGALSVMFIQGEMDIEQRRDCIDTFKKSSKAFILLASSKVAGEGLTLTEANHVIFLNEWWNPSSNAQARDRVVRIGQKRNVKVYKFICKGTVEENLQRILKEKGALFTNIIEKLADQHNSLDTALLSKLIEPSSDK